MTKAILACAGLLLVGACSAADLLGPGDDGYEACEFRVARSLEIEREAIDRCASITIIAASHDRERPR